MQGHYGYYGITGNARSLHTFAYHVARVWKYWLSHRSQRGKITWTRFYQGLLRVFPLPSPVVVHSVYRTAKP